MLVWNNHKQPKNTKKYVLSYDYVKNISRMKAEGNRRIAERIM